MDKLRYHPKPKSFLLQEAVPGDLPHRGSYQIPQSAYHNLRYSNLHRSEHYLSDTT